MKKNVSMNKKGISSILVVAILVVAVVAVAGVYVVLKNNDSGDDGGDEEVIGKVGLGSKFYYDSDTKVTIGDSVVTAAEPKTTVVAEVIAENAEYYFLKIVIKSTTNYELGTLKLHKVDGSIDQGKNVNGKWQVVTYIDRTSKVDFTLTISNYVEFGPMISTMEIKMDAGTMRADLNTLKNELKEPAAYAAPEFYGKFCNYSYAFELNILKDGIAVKALMDGTMGTLISGSATNGMMIESKMDMTLKASMGGKVIYSTEYNYSQMYISDNVYDIPENADYGDMQKQIINYDGKDRTVYKVTFDFVTEGAEEYLGGTYSFEMTAYVDVDEPIMYFAEGKAKIGSDITLSIDIKLIESNF